MASARARSSGVGVSPVSSTVRLKLVVLMCACAAMPASLRSREASAGHHRGGAALQQRGDQGEQDQVLSHGASPCVR
jgi:hypothetical protein